MGERSYVVHMSRISFSEGDDTFGCLCTFPHNDIAAGEKISSNRLVSLAMLGAATVLALEEELEPGSNYLPYGLPNWMVKEFGRWLQKLEHA